MEFILVIALVSIQSDGLKDKRVNSVPGYIKIANLTIRRVGVKPCLKASCVKV